MDNNQFETNQTTETIETPVYSQPEYTETQTSSAYDSSNTTASVDPLAQMANKIMVLGIVACAVSSFGIPGIILAAICGSKVKEFLAAGGMLVRKAKAGNICRRVALPLSIVMTVFWVVYICAVVAMIAAGTASLLSGRYY